MWIDKLIGIKCGECTGDCYLGNNFPIHPVIVNLIEGMEIIFILIGVVIIGGLIQRAIWHLLYTHNIAGTFEREWYEKFKKKFKIK